MKRSDHLSNSSALKENLILSFTLVIALFITLFSSLCLAANKNDTLNVILDWYPNPLHAPIIIAEEKGFFKEKGLNVNILIPNNHYEVINFVTTKKADIGITYQPQFMEQIDKGKPLIRIGTLIDKPLNCIVASKASGITKPADLKGKKIGLLPCALNNVILKTMLSENNLTERDVEIVKIKGNLSEALLQKRVDAVSGIMRNFELPMLELNNKNIVVFFPEENGTPNYSELIFMSHINNGHDNRFPRFLSAIKKAIAYLTKHPQKGWALFIKKYPEANTDLNQKAWATTLPYFAEDPANFDAEEWESFSHFMIENQLIKKAQMLSRYAVLPEYYLS